MRQSFMRVMVSLNLADIMTATHPSTPPTVYETPNNDPTDPSQESQHPINYEPITNSTELIE